MPSGWQALRASVPRETWERLQVFADLILRWNARLNLFAPGDATRIVDRHIADSLQFARLIPEPTSAAIDLGSGGGFPGLVLAIATGLPFWLVEADQRKAGFLREAARVTAAPAVVIASRAERVSVTAGLVTARALAPLPKLLDLAAPRLAPGGVCLFAKGRTVAAELAAAERTWQMEVELIPSATSGDGVVLRLSRIVRR